MDILLFRKKTAKESLEFALGDGWRFYRSLAGYAASFCVDPESAFETLRKMNGTETGCPSFHDEVAT
jgi:hypothetical protein